MPGDKFNVFATFDRQVRVAVGGRRTQAATIWPSPSIIHYSLPSVFAAAAAALLVTVPIGVTAANDQPNNSSPVRLMCSSSKRVQSLAASGSWQEVEVNVTDEQFHGDCAVKVNFTSSFTEASYSYPDRQPALLLKVYKLQFRPTRSNCKENILTLKIYSILQGQRQADICNTYAVDALYMWVSEPIKLYMYVYDSTDNRASFSVAFITVLPVDICRNSSFQSGVLIVHRELYVFAPDKVFVHFLQKSTACTSSKRLRLSAANPFDALNVTVLAAPTNSSCWSLWLDELRIDSAGDRNFVVSTNTTVRYLQKNSTSGCNSSEIHRGFTLKFSVEAVATVIVTPTFSSTAIVSTSTTSVMADQSIFTSTLGGSEVKGTSEAVTIGSTVAAVCGAAGVVLVGAILVIRHRRGFQQPHKEVSLAMTSVLGLANTVAARQVNPLIHPYDEPSPCPRLHHGIISGANADAAPPTVGGGCADIVMADNDLYGTAIGS